MIGLFAASPYHHMPWEAMQEAILRRFVLAGDVVYDVGANIGLHSVLLASLVENRGAVHAFEANPELYRMLRKTFAQLTNGVLHEFGLSDRDGNLQLFVPENREMASLAPWVKSVDVQRCELRSIDSLLTEHLLPLPDLIKADIEGAELLMLRGAQKLFATDNPPIVLAEANRPASEACGYSSNEIPQFLVDQTHAQYVVFVEDSPDRWVRRSKFADALHQYVLAIPTSRMDRWPALRAAQALTIANGIVECA